MPEMNLTVNIICSEVMETCQRWSVEAIVCLCVCPHILRANEVSTFWKTEDLQGTLKVFLGTKL